MLNLSVSVCVALANRMDRRKDNLLVLERGQTGIVVV
jgi:hypothetical protein